MEQVPSPDTFFWYTLAVLMLGFIVWILQRSVKKFDDLLKGLVDKVDKLIEVSIIHGERLNGHDEDIKDLKDGKYIVKYQRK